MDADQLLAGPRGRSLVWHLARTGDASDLWALEHRARSASDNAASFGWFAYASSGGGRNRWVDHVRHRRERRAQQRLLQTPVTTEEVPSALAAHLPQGPFDDVTLAEAFLATVRAARYWQPPDAIEGFLAHPDIIDIMRPAAQDVVAAPVAARWDAPIDPQQWRVDVEWERVGEPEPPPSLDAWAARVRELEDSVEGEVSGEWWSAPVYVAQATTGIWPGIGPAGLFLVEDAAVATAATVTPVAPPGTRVYEIDSAEAWAELCRAHPLVVTRQRSYDWGQATGRTGAWVTPDWSSVAHEWDGVHLTYGAYLAAATRAVDVEPGTASVIAGWAPDATYWFAPTVAAGEAKVWRQGETVGWREVGASASA